MTHNNHDPRLDAKLQASLVILDDVPEREANAVLRGRNLFLGEAHKLKNSTTSVPKRRHSKWMERFQTIFPFRKEGAPVLTQVISALLILITLLGGAGAGTVYAAQASMPDDVLYPIKTWSENARLDLAVSPEKDIDLSLKFAGRRIDEMLRLKEEGGEVPELLVTKLQKHLNRAAQLCDQTGDPLHTRQQMRQTLMNQERLLDNAPEDAQMRRTRDMIRQQIHQIDQTPVNGGALPSNADPSASAEPQDRDRLRTNQPEGSGNPDANGYQEEQTPGGPNANPDTPGQQNGGQKLQRTKTPMPGQSGPQQGPKN
jgi:hypothetical protein